MEHRRSSANRSRAWNYFIKKPGYIATCKICCRDFSYKGSVSNLSKHFERKHGAMVSKEIPFSDDDDSSFTNERNFDTHRYFEETDTEEILRCKLCSKEILKESLDDLMKHVALHGEDETDAESGTEDRKSTNPGHYRSSVWKFFTRKPGMIATCKLCYKDYSHRSTISNLHKHYKRSHGINVRELSYETDDDHESSVVSERKFSTRRYFTVTDKDNVLICKLCSKEIHQESVADLIKHIVEEHGNFDDTDTEDGTDIRPKSKLLVWLYFKPCVVTQEATCLICRAAVSYLDSVSKLKEHLETEHPLVKFDGGENSNRLLISADGDLYEVETGTPRENDDQDPIEMDTVYLDDFDDTILPQQIKKQPFFDRKKPIIPKKVKRCISSNNYKEDSIIEMPKQTPFKRKKREILNIKKEAYDSSSDDEITVHKRKDTCLELFGQYMVSLLKELPKRLSDQLQGDIIKQVITAKVNYEAEKVEVTAPVTLSNVVTVPVSVTENISVTESISDSQSLPVIMCNSDGTIQSIKHDNL